MSDQATQTRCPNCQTRFRVSGEQLTIASGKVRCGQCMTVFNALEHAVSQSPKKEPPATPQKSAPAQQPAPEPEKPTPAPEASADDEFIFDDNPEEDASERNYTGSKSSFEADLSDSFLSLDEDAPKHRFGSDNDFPDSVLDDETGDPVDESWAEGLLDELETDDSPREEYELPDPEPLETERTTRTRQQPGATPPTSAPAPDDSDELALEDDRGPEMRPRPSSYSREEEEDKGSDWRALRAEPIAASPARKQGRRRILWGLLTLLLVGILVAQVTWVQFDRLARTELLRPIYIQACQWVGCTLPQMVDIDRISGRQLVVRSHPDEPGALLVEAQLHNQANFAQPYPGIALSFSNLNNDIVAQRVFGPEEYLPTGIRGDLMGANQSVRISLSLQDPGRDAINYRMDFIHLRN